MPERKQSLRPRPKPGRLADTDSATGENQQDYRQRFDAQSETLREAQSDLREAQFDLREAQFDLREAESDRDDARDRFVELFDFAPNGYLTLDDHGVILRINLTGASWLGKSKTALEGMPLLEFIENTDRPRLADFMEECRQREDGQPLCADVRLRRPRSTDAPRDVQLLCRPRTKTVDRRRELFTAMVDVTERRRLENEREEALRYRAALTKRLISIAEDERQRIARDLHDNIGQQVTALRLKLDTIELVVGDNATARERLSEAQALGEVLDHALDFIASALRPVALDLGFATALEQFAHEWSEACGIAVILRIPSDAAVRLSANVETHLYRIVQEALHNIYKHARARSVVITVAHRQQRVLLMIEDDGIGFEALEDSRPARRGLGLASMRERAELMHGTIEFRKASSGGTGVMVEVPSQG